MNVVPPNDLIGHLYDAAIDPSLWKGMASRIAQVFNSTSTIVKFHGADGAIELLEATENMRLSEQKREWEDYWHRNDLWVDRAVAYGMDQIVTADMLVTPEEQRSSGFYRECLAEYDIFHVVGAAFTAGEGRVGVLGIHRPEDASPYDAFDQKSTALLLPHLARAVRLGRQLTKASFLQAAALDAFDQLDSGVVVLDRGGRIVYVNALANHVLQKSIDIRSFYGRFHLCKPSLHEHFAMILQGALDLASGKSLQALPSALAITRSGRLPLTLSVAPLRSGWSQGTDPGPLALVFIKDPEQLTLRLDRLRDLFGLTPTEAAIAADLGRGRSPEAIALAFRIGIGTVRWHIKSILAKTGASRQSEAVALLTHSVAALWEVPP
ncbi:helix-turn-helix transcriptional regulator [Acidisoma cellulosilytica]|uniref:Helix-turn-helix transcriptional regulator n=1 Tax=Acidisoma cellulosilyticum TaxID=2802395 RepID=A0A964E705_9PROT|nr:PAS domain-containing protein [Acidisoma cellulosilyticum]MCB8884131.1 helix-turn-helix transcriptional regulator [Acidisoma cellulosilyticum]